MMRTRYLGGRCHAVRSPNPCRRATVRRESQTRVKRCNPAHLIPTTTAQDARVTRPARQCFGYSYVKTRCGWLAFARVPVRRRVYKLPTKPKGSNGSPGRLPESDGLTLYGLARRLTVKVSVRSEPSLPALEGREGEMKSIGGLWKKKSKNGETYLSGKVNGAPVLVFVNKRKETNEKAPDFNVYEPEPRAETQQRQQTREAGDDSAERW